MSEGVSFNDDYARAVICVGMPLPNAYDRSVRSKRDYNDEQRRLRGRTDLLPGDEWYMQQAHRAVAQALGRVVRHAADYGAVLLLDGRHCDDGAPTTNPAHDGVPRAHRNLPKWMRRNVKNLRPCATGHGSHRSLGMRAYVTAGGPNGGREVAGGYPGLTAEAKRFFRDAAVHSAEVLDKQKKGFMEAQRRQRTAGGASAGSSASASASASASRQSGAAGGGGLSFDRRTGAWTSTAAAGKVIPKEENAISAQSWAVGGAKTSSGIVNATAAAITSPYATGGSNDHSAVVVVDTRRRVKDSIMAKSRKQGGRNDLRAMFGRQQQQRRQQEEGRGRSSAPANGAPASSSFVPGAAAWTTATPGGEATSAAVASATRPASAAAAEIASPALASRGEETPSTQTQVQPQSQTTHIPPTPPPLVSAADVPGSTTQDPAEEYFCVICEEERKTVLLLPCKHLCLCRKCSKLDGLTDCPMCRGPIKDTMEVFM
mmetsp:Transcript_30999/g.92914  ORF Transcript_30999/g.92914 Transcript_30999/m.92914 type:complete len:487 (-) Transcript_30999:510-1970(-)